MNQQMEIKDVVDAFSKKLIIISKITILLMICGGIIGYFTPPIYEAKVDLLVDSPTEDDEDRVPSTGDIDTNIRLIETYIQIIKSDRMASIVNKNVESNYSNTALSNKISVASSVGSQIITITAKEKTPKDAVILVNAYALTLQEEVKTLMNLNNITILNDIKEEKDTRLIKPNLLFYISLSFVFSIFVSVIIIFIKEAYFSRIDSERKVERILDIPLLGAVVSNRSELYDINNPNDLSCSLYRDVHISRDVYEDFSRLAANIHYLTKQHQIKTIMMTSASSGDGKTFIGGNLAVTLAMDNKKTLFLDADFRKADGRLLFSLPERKGITSVMSGFCGLDDIIQETGIKNLSFISTGPLPPNPTPFLISDQMVEIINDLKEMFDIIIVDTSALTVADAVSLLQIMDSALFVVNARSTTVKNAADAFQLLDRVNGSILGAVLNETDRSSVGKSN